MFFKKIFEDKMAIINHVEIYIVINKITKFTLCLHICLKKSVCFTSSQVFQADTGDNYCVDGGPLTLP